MDPRETQKIRVLCPCCTQPMVWRTWNSREDVTGLTTGWECTNLGCLRRVPSYASVRAQAA